MHMRRGWKFWRSNIRKKYAARGNAAWHFPRGSRRGFLAKPRMNLRSRGGSRSVFRIGRFRFFPADADEFGNARLLHRDAVEYAAHFHGLAVVGDDNELRLPAHFANQAGEATDVGFIEGRVDFVQDTEGAWLVAEDGDEQRQRGHGLFAPGEQPYLLKTLACGRTANVDHPLPRASR